MPKKILLVQPGKYGQFKPEIPIQLLYLSAVLIENGYQCQILDMRLEYFKHCDLSNTLCVGISTMTGPMIKYALEFARFVRENSPRIPIIWGGVHPSLVPEQTAQSPYVDVVVRGEGEITLLELVEAIEDNRSFSNIKGIIFKENSEIISNADRDFMDLNTLPIELPYNLIKMDHYNLNRFPLHTSRGCPHGCSFCYNLVYNRRSFRYKTAERVLDEIEYILKNFSPKWICFSWEDNFFVNKDRVRKICEGIIERHCNIEWGSFCRFDYASKYDEAFLQLIEKSGCKMLSFGAESGSQAILDSVINKGIKIEQILETSRKMAKMNIEETVSFMCGLPGESYEDFLATCNLVDQVIQINPKVGIVGIFFYTSYPGTPLIEVVKEKYGFLAPQTLEDWQGFEIYRTFGCTWLDKGFTRMLRGVSLMTRFNFYSDNREVPPSYKDFPYRYVYRICSYLAKLRWKYRFFKFPIEWLVIEKAMKWWRGWV